MNNANYLQGFEKPEMKYRSLPFWAWNSELDEEEIRRQIREMKKAGMGGFFMHSRDGLETEYLGEKWMNCVRAAVDEARIQGMKAWMYDEDRWPSGTAGGRVTAKGDAFRCKGLTLDVLEPSSAKDIFEHEVLNKNDFSDHKNGVVAVFAAKVEDDCLLSLRCLSVQEVPSFEEGEKLLLFKIAVSGKSEWFNHEAPPDNLNPECVKDFIRETHEKYKAVIGEEFGRTVPGIFTDEPSLHDRHASFGTTTSWIPWTYGYDEYFEKMFGYSFLEKAPFFFFHAAESEKVRHDYWQSINLRYGESYFKILSDWAEENGIVQTGHFLQEDKLGLATRVNGGIMHHYLYPQIPGIDMLCEQTKEYMTVKQCVSVAHQFGKKVVLSETYGCTGWEFTQEGQKWVGDWQYVMGINRRCAHLALYSLRGCRKRDYPPSFNYNNTNFSENSVIEDYFARFAYLQEKGDPIRNVLLLHPASTAWCGLGVSPYGNPIRRQERDVPAMDKIGNQFNELIEKMERQHYDVELGDELLIREYGQAGDKFVIGQAQYDVVVIPSMRNILSTTLEKLKSFVQGGGMVIAMTPHPVLLDGEPKDLSDFFYLKGVVSVKSEEELFEVLKAFRTISITEGEKEAEDILYQLRRDGEHYLLIMINNNREKRVSVQVHLPFAGDVTELDLLNGKMHPIETEEVPLLISTVLGRTGSKAFLIKEKPMNTIEIIPEKYTLDTENTLPLDYLSYALDGEELSEEMETWQAQMKIRDRLDMIQVNLNGLEQRYKWIHLEHPGNGHTLKLVYHFNADRPIKAWLVVERLSEFTVTLNGEIVDTSVQDSFLDREFKRCPLPMICEGENELILTCEYHLNSELENIYITGEFGVTTERVLTKLPDSLGIGDITLQGLKHYPGSVSYHFMISAVEGKKYWIEIPKWRGSCADLRCAEYLVHLPWDLGNQIEITDLLAPGENELIFTIHTSPRNMLGPFHLKEKPFNTHDESFCPRETEYSRAYLLEPYGLESNFVIYEV